MSTIDRIVGGYRVFGPNTANYKMSEWYFPTLEEARRFCENIARKVDSDYDIYEHVARIHQKPLEPRPLEIITPEPGGQRVKAIADIKPEATK